MARVPRSPEPLDPELVRIVHPSELVRKNLDRYPRWGDYPYDSVSIAPLRDSQNYDELFLVHSRFLHFFQNYIYSTASSGVRVPVDFFEYFELDPDSDQNTLSGAYMRFLTTRHPDLTGVNSGFDLDLQKWRLILDPMLREKYVSACCEHHFDSHRYEPVQNIQAGVEVSVRESAVPGGYRFDDGLIEAWVEPVPTTDSPVISLAPGLPPAPEASFGSLFAEEEVLPPAPGISIQVDNNLPPAPESRSAFVPVLAPAPVPTPVPAPKPAPVVPKPAPSTALVDNEADEGDETEESGQGESTSIFQLLKDRKTIVLGAIGAALLIAGGVSVSSFDSAVPTPPVSARPLFPGSAPLPPPLPPPFPPEKVKRFEIKQIDWGKEWEAERSHAGDDFIHFCDALKLDARRRTISRNEATEKGVYMTFYFSKDGAAPLPIPMKSELGAELNRAEVEAFAKKQNIDFKIAVAYLGYKDIHARVKKELEAQKPEILKYLKSDGEPAQQEGKGEPVVVASKETPVDKTTEGQASGSGPEGRVELTNESTSQTVTVPSNNSTDPTAASEYSSGGWIIDTTLAACPSSWDPNWDDRGSVAALMVVCKDGKMGDHCGFSEDLNLYPKPNEKNLVDHYGVVADNYRTVCKQTEKGKTEVYRLEVRRK